MVATLSFIIFAGALATAVAVIATMVGPQWRRIVRLATGHPDVAFAPLATLAAAERRIAVRRWAAAGSIPAISEWRAAA